MFDRVILHSTINTAKCAITAYIVHIPPDPSVNKQPLVEIYDYSHADWDGLCDHLRNVPWEDIFKVSTSAAACEFCQWVQTGIDA